MNQSGELSIKEQIIMLIELIDDGNERLLRKLFRIANRAVVDGVID